MKTISKRLSAPLMIACGRTIAHPDDAEISHLGRFFENNSGILARGMVQPDQ